MKFKPKRISSFIVTFVLMFAATFVGGYLSKSSNVDLYNITGIALVISIMLTYGDVLYIYNREKRKEKKIRR